MSGAPSVVHAGRSPASSKHSRNEAILAARSCASAEITASPLRWPFDRDVDPDSRFPAISASMSSIAPPAKTKAPGTKLAERLRCRSRTETSEFEGFPCPACSACLARSPGSPAGASRITTKVAAGRIGTRNGSNSSRLSFATRQSWPNLPTTPNFGSKRSGDGLSSHGEKGHALRELAKFGSRDGLDARLRVVPTLASMP